jgi:hypothetical protein
MTREQTSTEGPETRPPEGDGHSHAAYDPYEDFSVYSEGQEFPRLKKNIHLLTRKRGDYIVFLDEELYLHWYYNAAYEEAGFAKDYGEVVIRAENLEATSILLLKGPQLEVFRRLLGESIARLLEDRDSKNAHVMLDKAEVFLRARSRERARFWYLSATLVGTAAALAAGVLAWSARQTVAATFGVGEGAAELFLGAGFGAFGALISVLLRSDELAIDVSAGKPVHYFEGTMRALVGAAAGFLFALTIKSNILLGAVNRSERATPILLVVCIIAGASERLLPDLIKQLEGTLVRKVVEARVVEDDGGGESDGSDERSGAGRKRRFFMRKRR